MTIQTSSAPPRPDGGTRLRRPSVVLGVILTAQLMVMLDMTIMNVALPSIQTALGFTPTSLSWVLNAYTLAFGGLLLLGARAGDLFGRRPVFITGMALFSAASLLGGLASGPAWLVATRAAQGIGAALAAPAVLAVLMSTFTEGRERNRALGLFTAVSIGGAAVGLMAGGLLTQWASWRWVMFVNVPIGAAVVVAAFVVLPRAARATGHVDVAGGLTSMLGVSALVYGFVHAAEAGWGATGTIAAFVAAVVLLGLFVRTERRVAAPITPLALFADRNRLASYVGRLVLMAGTFGMFFFTTQFLQDVLGYSPIQTGLAYLPLSVALFVGSQFSARTLVERFGPRAVLVAGTGLSTMALAWLSQLSATSGYLFLLVPLVALGFGNGMAFVPLTAASLHGVQPQHAGAASGLVNVFQQVGGSLGLAVLVTVFSTASRDAAAGPHLGRSAAGQAQHAFVTGATTAIAVSAGLMALTVLIVSRIRTDRPRAVPVAAEPEADVDAFEPA